MSELLHLANALNDRATILRELSATSITAELRQALRLREDLLNDLAWVLIKASSTIQAQR